MTLPSGSALKKKAKHQNKEKRLKVGVFGTLLKWNLDLIIQLSKIDMKNQYYVYGDKEIKT